MYSKKENTNNILQMSEVYLAPLSAQNPGQLPTLITFKASCHFIYTDLMPASSKTNLPIVSIRELIFIPPIVWHLFTAVKLILSQCVAYVFHVYLNVTTMCANCKQFMKGSFLLGWTLQCNIKETVFLILACSGTTRSSKSYIFSTKPHSLNRAEF